MKPLNDAAGCETKLCAIGTTGVLPAKSIGIAEASPHAAQNLHSCCAGKECEGAPAGCIASASWQPAMASAGIAIGSVDSAAR